MTATKPKEKAETKPGIDLIEVAEARMNGTQEKATTSIASYKVTWRDFLKFLGNPSTFDSSDVDRYIAKKRKDGISKNTQRKLFFHLKALAVTNKIDWPFTRYDVPKVKEKSEVLTLNPDQLEQMVLSQHLLTDAERFYLAIATTFACRREAMAQMIKRDYDDATITIRGVHGSETVKHAVPDVIEPVLTNDWAGSHSVRALSTIFHKIAKKSGLKLDKGYGWHSVRRCVTSVMRYVLPANQLQESYWSEFTGWAKEVTGATFLGSAMMGHYTHPEVLNSEFMRKLQVLTSSSHDNDPYWMDHSIYLVHPFLAVWQKALQEHPVVAEA